MKSDHKLQYLAGHMRLLYQVVPIRRVRPSGKRFETELALAALQVVVQVSGVDVIRISIRASVRAAG